MPVLRFLPPNCVLLFAIILMSQNPVVANEHVDYATQIKPVLRERCYACHGALKQEAGLRLDTAALIIQGGDSGAAIEPGSPETSLLLSRVSANDESERMPPEGEPLSAQQIELLRSWILQNATAPSGESPDADWRDHWAFRTPTRPPVPQDSMHVNPIDAFLAHEHRKHGLTAQPAADKRIWLRRVSLDLIGLPPTLEQQQAFLADESEDSYEKVITRLLASPQYGQRWGRHWMDIWRYSDWWGLGAEVRNSQKHIWHWRDWIIESLNSDKGYDQMLREMLAADELYPNDLDRLRATGYLARQYFIFNRSVWLDETIEHTAKAMLGLTFNCAKCHDHKYDPLLQTEYYQLRAVFEPYQIRTEMVPGESDFEKDGIPRAFDAHLDIPTYLHIRGDDRNPDKSNTLAPAVPAFLASVGGQLVIEPVTLPIEATYPGLREHVVEAYRSAANNQIVAAGVEVEAAQKKLAESEAAAAMLGPTTGSSAEQTLDRTAQTTRSSEALVHDDFSEERTDVWQQLTGSWQHANGRLIQSQVGASRAAIRLKQLPPADFEARLKFIPTGGEVWKSVGISCDLTSDGNELTAYVSAFTGGPKAQFAYKQNGEYVYPPSAVQPRQVELGQPHEIVLRIRGTLLNVTVDGQHAIAFELPAGLPREPGYLELMTFDAAAEFVEFELRSLSDEVTLVQASTPPSQSMTDANSMLPVEQARLAVIIAEKTLQTAEAQLASIEARAAADRARHQVTSNASTSLAAEELAVAAAKAERVLAAARASEDLSRQELALLQATDDKKAEIQRNISAASAALETATQAVEMPSGDYTPLAGAKKTQEDYQNRNADTPYLSTSSGRRSAFAKWLTNPQNPLTARVAVNHIWARHMGTPLVPTTFDFGRNGATPTHPELLDWLAVELMEHNWSMKHIHQLIVSSQAYRMSSSSARADESNLTIDRDNRYYWRMNSVRMEAQIVRDSLLHLAGQLDLTLGGPPIPINDESSRRRSLYFVHSHNDHQKFLSMFDDASVLECYRRAVSIVPQQALALENSPLVVETAGRIAEQIESAYQHASDAEFIRTAFMLVLCAEPTTEELDLVTGMLPRLTEAARASGRPKPEFQARAAVVQALLNHNDFVMVR